MTKRLPFPNVWLPFTNVWLPFTNVWLPFTNVWLPALAGRPCEALDHYSTTLS